jgi:SAM-dependent MidA family methyltransferase
MYWFLAAANCFQLVAIYYLTRWMASSGKKVRLVELGPGRGTLMDDMLRVSLVTFMIYGQANLEAE